MTAQPRISATSAPTDSTGEKELNQFNINMRSQPWYVEWHRSKGLNPGGYQNRKLSGEEQDELESLVSQHMFGGRPVGKGGMTIDSGGSLNQKGGWAGLPTWAKVAVIAGATVATAGVAAAVTGPAAGPVAMGGTSAAKGAGALASTGLTAGSAAAPVAASVAAPVAATTATGAIAPIASKAMQYAPYVGTGLNFLGNYLNGKTEEGMQDRGFEHDSEQNRLSREHQAGENLKNRESTQQQLIADFLGSNLNSDTNEQLGRSRMALDATQMDPYAHAKALNSANVRRSFGEGVDASGYFKGKYDLSAVSPQNLKSTGDKFQGVMNEARNGPAGWDEKKEKERKAILEYLQKFASPGAQA